MSSRHSSMAAYMKRCTWFNLKVLRYQGRKLKCISWERLYMGCAKHRECGIARWTILHKIRVSEKHQWTNCIQEGEQELWSTSPLSICRWYHLHGLIWSHVERIQARYDESLRNDKPRTSSIFSRVRSKTNWEAELQDDLNASEHQWEIAAWRQFMKCIWEEV